MGETVVVMLKADRVRDGTDGSKAMAFLLVDPLDRRGGSGAQAAAAGAGAAQAIGRAAGLERGREGWHPALSEGQSARDTAIRRAVALKAAVDFETDDATIAVVIETAEAFDRWLGRPV